MRALMYIALILSSLGSNAQSPYRIVSAQAMPYTDPTYFLGLDEEMVVAVQYQGQFFESNSAQFKTLGLFSNYAYAHTESDIFGVQMNVLTENDLHGYQLTQVLAGLSYKKLLSPPRSIFQHAVAVGFQIGLNNFRLAFEELWFSSQFDQSLTQVQMDWDSGEQFVNAGNFNDTYWPINGGIQYQLEKKRSWGLKALFSVNQINEPVARIDVANFRVNRNYLGHVEFKLFPSNEFASKLWTTFSSQANSNILQTGIQANLNSNSNGEDWEVGLGLFSNFTSRLEQSSLIQLGVGINLEWMNYGIHLRYLQPITAQYNVGGSLQIGLSYFPFR